MFAAYADLLTKQRQLNKMGGALALLRKLEKVGDTPENALKRQALQQQLAEALSVKCAYDVSDSNNRDLLQYEAVNGYFYRPEQLEKIDEIYHAAQSHSEILAQMPTGFGKTYNLIPTLNKKMGGNGQLVVNSWPDALEKTNAHDVGGQMKKSFQKRADRVVFDRSSAFTIDSLQYLYDEMKRDIDKGRPLNNKAETLRALEHHLNLTLKSWRDKKPHRKELEGHIELFVKILRLLRTRAYATIDEAHKVLESIDKLIYTLGAPIGLPEDQVAFVEELFGILMEEPFASMLSIENDGQHHLKKRDYWNTIAPQIAERYAQKLDIAKENRDSFLDFTLGKVDGVPSWIEKHPKRHLIAFLKGQLVQVLKTSLKGRVDEHYGLSAKHFEKIEYAIAYSSSNTPKENDQTPSQFKNPHETLNKTYLTYLHKGLTTKQVHKLFDRLKKELAEEVKEGVAPERCHAACLYRQLLSNAKKPLYKLTDSDIDAVADQLRKNRSAIFYYVRNIVAPQIKVYPQNLVSTVQNYRSQFAGSLSTTATPQPKEAHGPSTHYIPMKGTDGQVSHLLLTKSKDPSALHIAKALDAQGIVDEAIEVAKQNPRIHATIDVGAQIKGLSNVDAAEAMRQKLKEGDGAQELEGILFFDEKEEQYKIMDIATGTVQDPAAQPLEPEERHTFYSQKVSYGSDIKQAVDASALLLMGKGVTKASAGQAAGRMRQLAKEQGVEWLIQQALAENIFGKDKDPSIMELLVYMIGNQAKAEAENNFQAQKQQMDNEIRRAIMDKILGLSINPKVDKKTGKPAIPAVDAKVNIKKALKVFFKAEKELVSAETLDPYALYAGITTEKGGVELLREYRDQCLKKVDKLSCFSRGEKKVVKGRINAYEKKWSDKDNVMLLPKKMRGQTTDLEMEAEVLEEAQTQVQEQSHNQTQEKQVKRQEWHWPEKMDLFKQGWEKPSRWNFYDGLIKLIRGIGTLITAPPRVVFNWALKVLRTRVVGVLLSPIAIPVLVGARVFHFPLKLAGFFAKKIVPISRGKNRSWHMGEVVKKHLPNRLKKAAGIFDRDFLVSNNFLTQRPGSWDEEVQVPFDDEQKPLYQLLVIQDKSSKGNKVTVMAIDQNDSVYFRRCLKADKDTDGAAAAKRDRKICVYDLQNGIVAQSKNGFGEEELERHPDFIRLLTQAKIFNGEINYNKQELEVIESKAKAVGKDKLSTFFSSYPLARRPNNKTAWRNKPIARRLT